MAQSPSKILIVDDSLEDQETYRRYLGIDSANCYEIHAVADGATGLEFCAANWPDLILLD